MSSKSRLKGKKTEEIGVLIILTAIMKVFVGLLALIGGVVAAPNLGIVGGQDAAPGEYPFAAAIGVCQINTSIKYDCVYACSAIILNGHWALTSATCATSVRRGTKLIVGNVALSDFNGITDLVEINPTYFVIHPDYKRGISTNDIALVKLIVVPSLKFNDLVQPAKLPAQGTEPSGDAVLIGWGSTGDTHNSNNLKAAHVSILSQTECQSAVKALDKPYQDVYDTTSNICTGPLTGVNQTCSLDTGGALVQDGQVIGLVSWTVFPCGKAGVPSVFTKISNYIDWINDNTK